jgi:hypothetical protein
MFSYVSSFFYPTPEVATPAAPTPAAVVPEIAIDQDARQPATPAALSEAAISIAATPEIAFNQDEYKQAGPATLSEAAIPSAAASKIALNQEAKKQAGPATLQESICNELQNIGFNPITRSKVNPWTGILRDARLSRHSKYPGEIYRDFKHLHFQTGEYYVDVSKAGNVKYQIKIKGSYYDIDINEIVDPAIKANHARQILPLLPQIPVNKIRLTR